MRNPTPASLGRLCAFVFLGWLLSESCFGGPCMCADCRFVPDQVVQACQAIPPNRCLAVSSPLPPFDEAKCETVVAVGCTEVDIEPFLGCMVTCHLADGTPVEFPTACVAPVASPTCRQALLSEVAAYLDAGGG